MAFYWKLNLITKNGNPVKFDGVVIANSINEGWRMVRNSYSTDTIESGSLHLEPAEGVYVLGG